MQIIPLSEGKFTVDASKVFVPFNPETDDISLRPRGSLLVEIQPFALVAGGDIIIIDTGLGYREPSGELQIHANLKRSGIGPDAVTKVLISHLHKDHAGGMYDSEKKMPAFPNAVYHVNKEEWSLASEKGPPSYLTDEFRELEFATSIHWLDAEGVIGENIHYKVTGGHCPFHTSFLISEGNQSVFFGGDVAPQWRQMKTRYLTKYDNDPRRSMELRQEWVKIGTEKKWTFLFYHDISHPVITL